MPRLSSLTRPYASLPLHARTCCFRACTLAALALATLTTLTTTVAHADSPTAVDMTEHVFGASNTNAVAGHGGLTAGISADGDLSVLSWPNPSTYDQLAYIASNDLNVRDEPHLGALDGMGSYVGLRVTTAQGTVLVWLRDTSFSHVQRYTQPDAPVVETTFTRADLGLTVVLTDIVSPDVDVLTRRVVVTRAAGSPVTDASLVLYENLSPTLSEIPQLPFGDWILDSRNDFVAAYDRTTNAIVHVHPSDRGVLKSLLDVGSDPTQTDYGPVDALMRTLPSDSDVDNFIANLDSEFPPGVAALVTTDPPPAEVQVGSDATPLCVQAGHIADNILALQSEFPGLALPIDPSIADAIRCTDSLPALRTARGWNWMPGDALADLQNPKLSGSRIAAGQTNASLVAPLVFQNDVAEGAALFAFGASVAMAKSALATATSVTAALRQTSSEQAAHMALSGIALPDSSLGDRVVAVAQRSLVNLYVARARSTGAVVASISRQPSYALDWARDGSFITQTMIVSGALTPWGATRAEWYAGLERREPAVANPLITPSTPTDPTTGLEQFPADAWEMNYYGDGVIGGNIRFEIDNTALHIWAVASQAAALHGGERDAFILKVWPTTRDALALLERWKDPTTNLPAPANEDDHFELTSTLHGATAVYAAVSAGARLAAAAHDEDAAQAALARMQELHDAILAFYYDPQTKLFRDTQIAGADGGFNYIPGTIGTDDTAWLAWPARFLDADDPRLEAQLMNDMNAVMPDVLGQTAGGAYLMKNVVSAALLGKSGGSRDLARTAVLALANIATPDTNQFGEVFVTTHPNGSATPVFSQRVAPPHVWEGILFYLSAMALTSPDKFDPQLTQLPMPTGSYAAGGCTEATTSRADRAWPSGVWMCGLLLAWAFARGRLRVGVARGKRR